MALAALDTVNRAQAATDEALEKVMLVLRDIRDDHRCVGAAQLGKDARNTP